MKLIIKEAPELPQAFLLISLIFLTIGVIGIVFIDVFSGNIIDDLSYILFLLICDVIVGIVYYNTRKKFIKIVKERKKLDEGKSEFEPTDKSLWLSPGIIYLLRLGWIPIILAVSFLWYLFGDSKDRLIPVYALLVAFVIFVIYAIVAVRHLEKRKK